MEIRLPAFVILVMLCFAPNSFAIVIRDDVSAQTYELEKHPEHLIDMPHEGHGVLIQPQWILTVAHVIFYDYTGKPIIVADKEYKIEKVITHPQYKKIPEHLLKGSSLPLMAFFKNNHDIALIKLASPVKDAQPIALYTQSDEVGKRIEVYGKGATGNGRTGQIFDSKKDKVLRYCQNTVSSAKNQWLSYTFDPPKTALPLEGMHGSGDSGGPSIIYQNKTRYLIGLSAWQYIEGELGKLTEGLYGTPAYQVRVSYYKDWIDKIIHNNK